MHVDDKTCKSYCSGRGHEPVHAIHDAAMAGDEATCIFGTEAPLDRRLDEIAGLRHD